MAAVLSHAGAPWLDAASRERLEVVLDEALRRARRRGGPVLTSFTTELTRDVDPTAAVAGSRVTGEPWFCLEQPERDGFSLAALGRVREIEEHGQDRFARASRRWSSIAAAALAERPEDSPPGAGLAAFGGFSFSSRGGVAPPWGGFAALSLQVPELSLARRGGRAWLTLNSEIAPDDTAPDVLSGIERRLGELRDRPLPLSDPSPTGDYRIFSPMPPSHFEDAVQRAVDRIRAGELEKVVLAREVQSHAPIDHDPAGVLGLLRQEFPACYVFAVGRGRHTFVAASPELLVRREGQRASTVALAGSARRSADPAVDDHLGEQLLQSGKDREENAIVARRISRALSPHAVWVTMAPEPTLVRVANIQHLGRPIRAQLAAPLGAVELAGVLHPTPAVGGEPTAIAERLIPTLEGLDRGWYTGGVGWTDASGDGEFCVGLRCALLTGTVAHCYAGCGIVRDSSPAAELAESELKLEAILPALAG